jgi:hypothetical protein
LSTVERIDEGIAIRVDVDNESKLLLMSSQESSESLSLWLR